MKKRFFRIKILILSVVVLMACNPPVARETPSPKVVLPPTPTQTTVPPPREETAVSTPAGQVVLSTANLNKLRVSREFEVEYPQQLKWSDDSQLLAARNNEHIFLYDIFEGVKLAEAAASPDHRVLDYSPDSRLAAYISSLDTLELVDIESGLLESSITPGYTIYGAEFLPGGKQVAILDADEISFSIWDIVSGEKLNTYTGFQTAAPVYSVTFSEDGKTAIWYARATVQTTRLSSGQMGPVLSHQEFIGGLTTLDDKNWLAAASAKFDTDEPQPLIQLWDTLSGEELTGYLGCEMIPMSLDFSPDGRLLSASCQQSVIIWDAANREILADLDSFSDSATSVKFSPDGSMLATASNDGLIRVWSVVP